MEDNLDKIMDILRKYTTDINGRKGISESDYDLIASDIQYRIIKPNLEKKEA